MKNDLQLADLPIIDWALANKLAGNNKSLARDLIELFLQGCPAEQVQIKQHFDNKQFSQLATQLHRLKGALSYCGLPRLKKLVIQLESNIKNNIMDDLKSLLNQFDIEVKLAQESFSFHQTSMLRQ